ncbi:hypothetical protein PG984_007032 [Apiospora sp. TS-2023a]
MATADSNKFLLLVDLDEWVRETLQTNRFHLLSLDKSELSDLTVEGLSKKVRELLEAIAQKMLLRMFKDPSRRDECQLRTLDLDPWLYDAAEPKHLSMQWGNNRSVRLGGGLDDAAFKTWWEYWQKFKSTDLCLAVVTNWGHAY